jgi:transcriptional regulator
MGRTLAVTKGTLDVIVLRALAWNAMHGFEIVNWIEESTRYSLDITDAAVYQALYRMEQRGLVKATWGVTENNRRARYYQLTDAGNAHLRDETSRWLEYTAVVTGLLTAPIPARTRR